MLTHTVPGANGPGQAMRGVHVVRPDGGAQAIDRVVGEPYRLGLVVERDHDDDRTEYFLLRDAHVVAHVVENGRLDVIAAGLGHRALAAERDARAFLDADVDIAEHALHMALLDDGAELRGGLEGMAERNLRALDLGDLGDELRRGSSSWTMTREPAWQVSPWL